MNPATGPAPIRLCDAKSWFVVYSTGKRRGNISTRASNFVYYNDACTWAHKQRAKGFDVRIEEEHACECP